MKSEAPKALYSSHSFIVSALKKLVKPIIGKFIIDGQNVELPGFVVEWENYDDTTEEPEVNLMKDVPKLVRKFKKDKKISFKKDAKGKWKIIKG